MATGLINANPVVYERKERRVRDLPIETDEYAEEPIDQLEIFDIKDPEHPYSLEELKVVAEDSIEVNNKQSHVRVTFTPTVEHCSMATIIGLCLRVKLMRSLPPRYKSTGKILPIRESKWIDKIGKPRLHFLVLNKLCLERTKRNQIWKVDIRVAPGTHATEAAVNKQLNDKERVAAALENPNLVEMVDECLAPTFE